MIVSYNGLWIVRRQKGVKKQNLVDDLKLSSATAAKMRNIMKKVHSLVLMIGIIVALLVIYAKPVHAGNVKTNVVSQIMYIDTSGRTRTYNCSYNANGLLSEMIDDFGRRARYKYNSKGLLKTILLSNSYSDEEKGKVIFSYNKKNQMIKRVTKAMDGSIYVKRKYRYKKGTLSKMITTKKASYAAFADTEKRIAKFTFNKKGLLTKQAVDDMDATYRYTYDKKGNRKKIVWTSVFYGTKQKIVTTRKNTYTGNRLTGYKDKRKEKLGTIVNKCYYKPRMISWKTISVPKSKMAVIKEQQREISNGGGGGLTGVYHYVAFSDYPNYEEMDNADARNGYNAYGPSYI